GAGGRRGGRGGQLGGVPGLLHHRDQLLGADSRRHLDAGLLGGVVDRGADPLEPVQLLLHAGRAAGAGHSADLEVDQLQGGYLLGIHGHRALRSSAATPPPYTPGGYGGKRGRRAPPRSPPPSSSPSPIPHTPYPSSVELCKDVVLSVPGNDFAEL